MSKKKTITSSNVRVQTTSRISHSKPTDESVGLHFGFFKSNYKWLFLGLALNVLGFLLMIGGGASDPNVFNEEALFSTVRLTISPMLIVGGYVVILFAIMKRSSAKVIAEPDADQRSI